MSNPTAVFVDFEQSPNSNLAAEARFGLVAFRKRPPDTTCHHPSVDFGKPERLGAAVHVSVMCMGCGHGWESVKVTELKEGGR